MSGDFFLYDRALVGAEIVFWYFDDLIKHPPALDTWPALLLVAIPVTLIFCAATKRTPKGTAIAGLLPLPLWLFYLVWLVFDGGLRVMRVGFYVAGFGAAIIMLGSVLQLRVSRRPPQASAPAAHPKQVQ